MLNPSSFNIEALITDMEMMFGTRAREKHLEFVIEKDPNIILSIEADRGKISQILINLLNNAVRYTHIGSITLRVAMVGASDDRRHLIFEVQDTGEGIASKHLERIFDPFVQIGVGSPQRAGTGLGLAISRQYARMMNGDVAVESRIGEGSIFRLRIPVIRAAPALPKSGLTPSRRIVGIADEKRELRCLVVDDEPSNRDVLIRMLSPVGFDIREAAGGQEAIALFESWSPHLILMDIRMPEMDGFEVCARLKENDALNGIPVLFLSAVDETEGKVRAFELGGADYITKPFQAEEVLARVKTHLDLRKASDNLERLNEDLE